MTSGSSTKTVWNLLARAVSFSMCSLYSLIVVAPMHCSSPRARAGFRMLAASIAPSAAPAPMIVCTSSMKMIMLEVSLISFTSRLSLSSNSPRYLVPATIDAISRDITCESWRISGTCFLMIFCARPSTIAVFPTPASPMSMGLFFLLRERIRMTRFISSSLPITGSSWSAWAALVRSWAYSSRADGLDAAFAFWAFSAPTFTPSTLSISFLTTL